MIPSLKVTISLKRTILLLTAILMTLLYFYFNHPTGAVHILQTEIDKQIPFIPVFALPYIAFLVIFWIAFIWSYLTSSQFARFAISLIIIYAVSYITYYFYQTYIPRAPVPGDDLMSKLVIFIYSNDQPYNGFPSTHASLATLLAYYSLAMKHRFKWLIVAFSALVIASTFLIKQHYVLDAVSGITLGAIVSFFCFTKLKYGGKAVS